MNPDILMSPVIYGKDNARGFYCHEAVLHPVPFPVKFNDVLSIHVHDACEDRILSHHGKAVIHDLPCRYLDLLHVFHESTTPFFLQGTDDQCP